jgi:CBS domain-containing protein
LLSLRLYDLQEDPVTHSYNIAPNATVADAVALMRTFDVSHLPVIEGEALVGILSEHDIAPAADPCTLVRNVMKPIDTLLEHQLQRFDFAPYRGIS